MRKNTQQLKSFILYGEALEWLNGELLGDGCVRAKSSQTASFVYGSKFLEYIKYVSYTLRRFGIIRAGKIRRYYNKKYGNWLYMYTSCSYYELKFLQELWYPDGIKDVPVDLELTPLVCRQWYIGDGTLACSGHTYFIVLSTQAFSKSGVVSLAKQLTNIGIQATRQLSSNTIYISTHSVKDFLTYIGKCPVDCYKYKWEVS